MSVCRVDIYYQVELIRQVNERSLRELTEVESVETVRLMKQLISVERREVVEGEDQLLERLVKSREGVVVDVGQLIVRQVETRQPHQSVAVYRL